MGFLAEANTGLLTALGVLFVLNAIALIVFVLFRQSDSGGLGAAFGGGDDGGALGTKGQAFVDRVITFMGAAFIVLALVFSLASTSRDSTSGIEGEDSGTTDTGEGK